MSEQETALNSPGKHRFQKLANTAEKAFADRAILLDENKFLFEQNNEKMTRSSIRLTVTGTTRIMTYEDIIEAQRKRDIEEATTAAKTAGRKRQNSKSPPMMLLKNALIGPSVRPPMVAPAASPPTVGPTLLWLRHQLRKAGSGR